MPPSLKTGMIPKTKMIQLRKGKLCVSFSSNDFVSLCCLFSIHQKYILYIYIYVKSYTYIYFSFHFFFHGIHTLFSLFFLNKDLRKKITLDYTDGDVLCLRRPVQAGSTGTPIQSMLQQGGGSESESGVSGVHVALLRVLGECQMFFYIFLSTWTLTLILKIPLTLFLFSSFLFFSSLFS